MSVRVRPPAPHLFEFQNKSAHLSKSCTNRVQDVSPQTYQNFHSFIFSLSGSVTRNAESVFFLMNCHEVGSAGNTRANCG
jgi:hypothetical protein